MAMIYLVYLKSIWATDVQANIVIQLTMCVHRHGRNVFATLTLVIFFTNRAVGWNFASLLQIAKNYIYKPLTLLSAHIGRFMKEQRVYSATFETRQK